MTTEKLIDEKETGQLTIFNTVPDKEPNGRESLNYLEFMPSNLFGLSMKKSLPISSSLFFIFTVLTLHLSPFTPPFGKISILSRRVVPRLDRHFPNRNR